MKKRLFSIVLSLCIVMALMPQMVFAETTADGNFEYSVTGDEVTITKYTGDATALTIPSTIDSKTVTAIGESAFSFCTSIKSVTIPEGVTSIEKNAFFGCTSLESVTIPNGVTSIGGAAFYNCTNLKSVTIPEGVTSIGGNAFYNCTSIESVTIPKSVTSIGENAFLGCTSLTSITVDPGNSNYSSVYGVLFNKEQTNLIIYPARKTGNSYDISNIVTSIDTFAFYGCTNLESVTIPAGVTAIPIGIFKNCTSLKSVTIPKGVTSIGGSAFENCTSLESVTIPEGVTSIGGAAFKNCTSLESITVPDSVTSIGAEAFYNCTTLKNVTIPEDVTYIGPFAFYYCTSLKSVTIPKGVTRILDSAFARCTSLESVTFEDYSQLTEIGDVAFADCTSLKRVILPNGVTRILDSAFARCTSLESVEVPSSVSYTDWGVFNKCTSLESIFLPNNVDASDAEIPDTASQVRYSLDNDKVTITEIELGKDKESVDIPETICGYPVVAVAASEQNKVGEHIHVGTATCKTEGTCTICGEPYILPHDFSADKKTAEALKTAGTCKTEAEYYYSCAVCDSVEKDDNHIFTGEKDGSNHTGGTEIRGAKDATCMEEGYTGDTHCKGCGAMLSAGSSKNKLKHDLVKTPAKDATAAETGNDEYWQCIVCDKYFSDENGTNEITLDDTITQKLPPEIIKGKGQSLIEGEKKALSFTSNAAYSDFIRVELDGSELSEEYYEKAEGSIIITLNADYVATLPAGEHTIGIVSTSGTAETTFTVAEKAASGTTDDSDKDSKSDEDSVKTGDDANLALWLALMLLSGVGITGVTAYTRRKRTNE